mmetsp:Transcript_48189/g.92117  ORF Transcript_48189/g.92117 Transcript_48189/m.92117 type:complete len:422 (-) Transcript_48189:685-1950(-)
MQLTAVWNSGGRAWDPHSSSGANISSVWPMSNRHRASSWFAGSAASPAMAAAHMRGTAVSSARAMAGSVMPWAPALALAAPPQTSTAVPITARQAGCRRASKMVITEPTTCACSSAARALVARSDAQYTSHMASTTAGCACQAALCDTPCNALQASFNITMAGGVTPSAGLTLSMNFIVVATSCSSVLSASVCSGAGPAAAGRWRRCAARATMGATRRAAAEAASAGGRRATTRASPCATAVRSSSAGPGEASWPRGGKHASAASISGASVAGSCIIPEQRAQTLRKAWAAWVHTSGTLSPRRSVLSASRTGASRLEPIHCAYAPSSCATASMMAGCAEYKLPFSSLVTARTSVSRNWEDSATSLAKLGSAISDGRCVSSRCLSERLTARTANTPASAACQVAAPCRCCPTQRRYTARSWE